MLVINFRSGQVINTLHTGQFCSYNIIEVITPKLSIIERKHRYYEKGDEYILSKVLHNKSKTYNISTIVDILEKEVLLNG